MRESGEEKVKEKEEEGCGNDWQKGSEKYKSSGSRKRRKKKIEECLNKGGKEEAKWRGENS